VILRKSFNFFESFEDNTDFSMLYIKCKTIHKEAIHLVQL